MASALSQNQAIANAAAGVVTPAPFGGTGPRGLYAAKSESTPSVPVRPAKVTTLTKAHQWHPIPPQAFKIPKEPLGKSTAAKVKALRAPRTIAPKKVTAPKLSSSYAKARMR